MWEALPDVAKFTFVQTCGLIPIIGPTAATAAQNILNLAERARHNKAACKYISKCVRESLEIIAKSNSTSQAVVESRENYNDVLHEIEFYVIEIDTPGTFTKRAKEWLMRISNANNVAAANENLLKKLDDATKNFQVTVAIDTNNTVGELKRKIEGVVEMQIMIAQKADDHITETEIADLKINESYFEDEDDDDDYNKFPNKNIRKRLYCGDKVAVKKIPTHDLQLEQKIARQVKITSLLGRCNQIEKFYGIYDGYEKKTGTKCLFVVTEWMTNGNLREYLFNNKSISWSIKLKISEQIAKGLNFCSGVNVYHRDVRSKNVLLDENLNAKLTNFEMSRKFSGKSTEMPLESLRWTAPEKIKFPKTPYTDKCEVYSFAILLWEISSHQVPFAQIDSHLRASEKAKDGDRPPFPDDTPERYKRVVMRAWQQNPNKRPSINEIRTQLEDRQNRTPLPETPVLEDSEKLLLAQLPIDEIISLHKGERYEEAFPQFRQLAETGDSLASYYTGFYLYNGPPYVTEQDEIQALQLLQKSADGNEAQGQYLYAYACLKGSYYSPVEGLNYLKKAAENHNPDALYMISQFFLNGEHGHPVDDVKYRSYLEKAADRGSEKAKKELSDYKNNLIFYQ